MRGNHQPPFFNFGWKRSCWRSLFLLQSVFLLFFFALWNVSKESNITINFRDNTVGSNLFQPLEEDYPPLSPRKPLKIGVLTFSSAWETPFNWNKRREYLDALTVNRECYTRLHNYDNLFFSGNPIKAKNFTMPRGPSIDTPCNNGPCHIENVTFVEKDMRVYWNKVYILKILLERYDYIVWTDSDIFFMTLNRSIESFILEALAFDVDAHLWVPQEWRTLHPLPDERQDYFFSNAIFIIRNSDWGRYILNTWWDYGTGLKSTCPTRFFKTLNVGHDMNLDMPWLWHSMLMLYEKYYNVTIPCLRNERCENETLGECYYNWFESVGYPIVDSGSNLKTVSGPIIFTQIDKEARTSGLMQQANIGPLTHDKWTQNAFTIHAKMKKSAWKFYNKTTHQTCVKDYGCESVSWREIYGAFNWSVKFNVSCGRGGLSKIS